MQLSKSAMAIKSSFLLNQNYQEWLISEPRDCLEIGRCGTRFYKKTPEVEFSVPLGIDGRKSSTIYWYVHLISNGGLIGHNKPAFEISIYNSTRCNSIGKSIGIKSSLVVLDQSNSVLVGDLKSYSCLPGNARISQNVATWKIEIEKIPFNCSMMKLNVIYQAYGQTDGGTAAQPASVQLATSPPVEMPYTDNFTCTLDDDRKDGTTTYAILELGEREYKVHKRVLALQSDFFKARFSDRWEERKKAYVVDMI